MKKHLPLVQAMLSNMFSILFFEKDVLLGNLPYGLPINGPIMDHHLKNMNLYLSLIKTCGHFPQKTT